MRSQNWVLVGYDKACYRQLSWNSAFNDCKVLSVKRLAKFGMAVFAVSILIGCQYDPFAHGYLRTTPSEKDIVGSYRPDAVSRKTRLDLPMSGVALPIDAAAEIKLNEDHSATFIRVPADFQGSKPCTITGKGTWSVGQSSGKYYDVYLRIDNEEQSSPCRDFKLPLLLYGQKSPYRLHEVIDDPDLGLAVQFEKQQ